VLVGENGRVTKPPPLRDHVGVLILDRAAAVLAEHGAGASMAEIAKAAGLGRATVYRHFPTRDALLQAMAETAVEDLGDRLAEAHLDEIPVREAIARACRAFVTTGGKYIALRNTGHKPADPDAVDRRIGTPLHALVQRGAEEGTLRSDLAPELMVALFSALIETGLTLAAQLGAEQAAATVAALFLDGAATPPDPTDTGSRRVRFEGSDALSSTCSHAPEAHRSPGPKRDHAGDRTPKASRCLAAATRTSQNTRRRKAEQDGHSTGIGARRRRSRPSSRRRVSSTWCRRGHPRRWPPATAGRRRTRR
jgi:TetR/AcrR family transcriptional regulator, mexCD-oprJ operon repressor